MRARLGRELPLGRNFRSQPAILDFVNALAARDPPPPAGAADPEHWTRVRRRRPPSRPTGRRTGRGPAVRLVTFAGEHAPPLARCGGGARARGPRPRRRHRRPRGARRSRAFATATSPSSSARSTQVKAYEYALRRRGIPYYVVKGRGFFQCQEVRDVASLLATVARPATTRVALAAVLRSPFFARRRRHALAPRLAARRPSAAGSRARFRRARDLRGPARAGARPRPHPRPAASASAGSGAAPPSPSCSRRRSRRPTSRPSA